MKNKNITKDSRDATMCCCCLVVVFLSYAKFNKLFILFFFKMYIASLPRVGASFLIFSSTDTIPHLEIHSHNVTNIHKTQNGSNKHKLVFYYNNNKKAEKMQEVFLWFYKHSKYYFMRFFLCLNLAFCCFYKIVPLLPNWRI